MTTTTQTRLTDNYIAGRWTRADAVTGELDVTNPATGEAIARVPLRPRRLPIQRLEGQLPRDLHLHLHAHGGDAVEFFTRKKDHHDRYYSGGHGHGGYFAER